MSPRAAWRLESLGFTQVFDYVAGKADWSAWGLPLEGELAEVPRAGSVARRDVSTCRPTERIGDVRERLQASSHNLCVVTNDESIVLGRLGPQSLRADPQKSAEEVMEPAPTTTRPDDRLDALAERLRKAGVGSIVITTPDGRLFGVVYRNDAEQALAERDSPDR